MLLTVDAVTKESKTFGDKVIWGIKATDGNWYDFHGGFRPSKGQKLNAKIWSVTGKNGKEYMHADLLEPPPPPQQAQSNPAHSGLPSSPASYADFKKAEASAGPAKIKWEEWRQLAQVSWSYGLNIVGMPPEQCIGFVQTTLVALRDGKLELPSNPPVAGRDPGDDDPYGDPDSILPPGWGETRN